MMQVDDAFPGKPAVAFIQMIHTKAPRDRQPSPKSVVAIHTSTFLLSRSTEREATPFRYISAPEYLEKQPKFVETNETLYRRPSDDDLDASSTQRSKKNDEPARLKRCWTENRTRKKDVQMMMT